MRASMGQEIDNRNAQFSSLLAGSKQRQALNSVPARGSSDW